MRGEHERRSDAMASESGSSPHARGAQRAAPVASAAVGIIPACAGSTPSDHSRLPTTWDHPRMRGEHMVPPEAGRGGRGSSPHARGAPHEVAGHRLLAGIIPACAGSTRRDESSGPIIRDHPRMRGEHARQRFTTSAIMGSSPHARGALPPSLREGGTSGIIPACAGSTTGPGASTRRTADHPRMRGEHCSRSPRTPVL